MASNTELQTEYTLQFEQKDQYLYAYVRSEKATLPSALSYWSEIARRTIESGSKKLLVVEDIPDVISIAEIHQLVTELSDLPVKNVRVAFVDRYPEQASLNEFGILVGENRGFTVKAFETTEQADAWLAER